MLIKQIIELQLRDLGPPGQTCTTITGYFHGKKNLLRKSLSGLLFTAKMLQETMLLTSPYLDQITYN